MFCTHHFKIFKSSTATNLRFSLSSGAESRCSAPCRAAAYSSFYFQQHTRHERSDSFTLLSRKAVRKKQKTNKHRVCIAVSKWKTIHFHHTQIFNTQELRDALITQEEDVADALQSRVRGQGWGVRGRGPSHESSPQSAQVALPSPDSWAPDRLSSASCIKYFWRGGVKAPQSDYTVVCHLWVSSFTTHCSDTDNLAVCFVFP